MTALSNGDFFISWESEDQDGSDYGIYGQFFDSNGNKKGAEVQISGTSLNSQTDPNISKLENGGVVVSWSSYGQDGNRSGIYARIFDGSGNPQGNEFSVNTETAYDEKRPSITGLTGGGFVITWTGASHADVFAQIFDASGNRIGSELIISTNYLDDSSTVLALNDGGFFLAWEKAQNYGDLVGQKFDALGNKIGSEITLNTNTSGLQKNITLTLKNGFNLKSAANARNSISLINNALQTLNSQRASLGALSNRIDHIVTNNTNTATNIAKSISRIEDADFAAETTNLAKQQILQQAATAMLAQANASKQNILTLLNL